MESSSSAPARLEGEALESYMATMAEDLSHLFDDRGIDKSLYASDVSFEDPLTKYDNIDGYLFNISMLKRVFDPRVHHALHRADGRLGDIRRAGP